MLLALALELGGSPWGQDLLVTIVGSHPEFPEVLGTGRLRHVDRLDHVIAGPEGRVTDVGRVLDLAGVADVPSGRARQR